MRYFRFAVLEVHKFLLDVRKVYIRIFFMREIFFITYLNAILINLFEIHCIGNIFTETKTVHSSQSGALISPGKYFRIRSAPVISARAKHPLAKSTV